MRWDEQILRDSAADGLDTADTQAETSLPSSHASRGKRASGKGKADGRGRADQENLPERQIARYLAETFEQSIEWERVDPRRSDVGKAMLAARPDERREFVRRIVQRMSETLGGSDVRQLQALLNALLRVKNEWDEAILCELATYLAAYRGRYLWPLPTASVLRLVETHLADALPTASLKRALEDLRRLYKVRASSVEERTIFQRLDRLLRDKVQADAPLRLDTGEAWTETLADRVNALAPEERCAWRVLLEHAATATTPVPNPCWLAQADSLWHAVGERPLIEILTACLRAVGQPSDPKKFDAQFEHRSDPTQVHEQYSDLLRGLVWYAASTASDALVPELGRVAEVCFERLPRQRPRSLKVAVACVHALTMYGGGVAFQELLRLRSLARQPSIKSQVAAAVAVLSERMQLAPWQLAELAAPDLELAAWGEYRREIGRHTASILIESPGLTRVRWSRENQRPQHNAPAAVKSFHAAELAKLRKRAQEIEAELPHQRLRLERLFVTRAQWNYGDFRRHYLDHRLVGPLAAALIWRFSAGCHSASGLWCNGRWIDHAGQTLDWIDQQSQVRPWHPLEASADEVRDWQLYLEHAGICQPFKQAHREIYRPVPEECGEVASSRRCAGHLVEWIQLERAAYYRRWELVGADQREFGGTPCWDVPDWNLLARWSVVYQPSLVRYVGGLLARLGEISFVALDTQQPVPISSVPQVVYSEVIREIDCCFLQYGAFGNLAYLYPFCTGSPYEQYWRDVAFGPLTTQGETRRQWLERTLSRSKLANRCRLEERELVVRGDRNHYRIHLGSGQVLMGTQRRFINPRSHHLTADHTGLPPGNDFPRLPFGGDVRFASILHTASRLARDAQITDQILVDRISADPTSERVASPKLP